MWERQVKHCPRAVRTIRSRHHSSASYCSQPMRSPWPGPPTASRRRQNSISAAVASGRSSSTPRFSAGFHSVLMCVSVSTKVFEFCGSSPSVRPAPSEDLAMVRPIGGGGLCTVSSADSRRRRARLRASIDPKTASATVGAEPLSAPASAQEREREPTPLPPVSENSATGPLSGPAGAADASRATELVQAEKPPVSVPPAVRTLGGTIAWLSGSVAGIGAIFYAFGYLITLANLNMLGLDPLAFRYDPTFYIQRGASFLLLVAIDVVQQVLWYFGPAALICLVVRRNHRIPYWDDACDNARCARGSISR